MPVGTWTQAVLLKAQGAEQNKKCYDCNCHDDYRKAFLDYHMTSLSGSVIQSIVFVKFLPSRATVR